MIAEEKNPEEVFEITDYTTASDWERFIARVEEVVHEWKLSNCKRTPNFSAKDGVQDEWDDMKEEIYFSDFKFIMRRYFRKDISYEEDCNVSGLNDEDTQNDRLPAALIDMMSIENAFPGRAHCLTRWYGLQDFIVISPSDSEKGYIASESRMKLLLSSINIAVSNSNCHIPVFVQVHDPKESFYQGVCIGPGVMTNFSMAYLKNMPHRHRNLMGLLDIFREKLGSQTNQILVSTKFTFMLHEWNQAVNWLQQPPDFDSVTPNIGTSDLAKIPFGPYEDPISNIILYTTWPQIHADVVVDTEFNSSFSPLEAPLWSLRIRMLPEPRCLLGEYLEEFLSICYHEKAGKRLVPESALPDEENIGLALDRLTESVALKSISSVVGRAKKRLRKAPKEGCIPSKSLLEILFFIFPDAQDQQPSYGDGFESQMARIEKAFESEELKTLKEKMDQFKSAPLGSLPYLLALCMYHVNYSYVGLDAVSHLWQEFVLEMRYRWENSCVIPGLNPGTPHLGSGLLYQKLQMLNCCIERRKTQELLATQRASIAREGSSSDDEEFYDCDEEEYTAEEEEPKATSKEQPLQDSLSQVAEGRSRKCGDLKLLHSDQPLFIPITQDPAPMTEDQLQQHADVLVKLGADEEGKNLREKMQSVCLSADMQAFKAANPGCHLEDFIRWYSPKDWIEAEEMDLDGKTAKKGRLSSRMQTPGNIWQEVWQSAKPLAARKQKRLFDETKEAEKVMHFLANICPYEVVLHLMPMLVHLAIATIVLAKKPYIEELIPMLESIAATAAKLTKASKRDVQDYEVVIDQLSEAEATVARANAVCGLIAGACEGIAKKDSDTKVQEFALSLLEHNSTEVNIPEAGHGILGKGVRKLFENVYGQVDDESKKSGMGQDCVLGSPVAKEMILRAKVPRPAAHSTHAPQRMYCVLTDKDVRLAGAFTQDTIFF